MGCEEDVAKIGKRLENMVANGTTASLLHIIINKQNKNGSTVRGRRGGTATGSGSVALAGSVSGWSLSD